MTIKIAISSGWVWPTFSEGDGWGVMLLTQSAFVIRKLGTISYCLIFVMINFNSQLDQIKKYIREVALWMATLA